jgi:hypothetical protein
MSDVLSTLEQKEERSQIEILNDLNFSNADIVRIKSDVREAADGTLPLEEAVALVQRAKEAILAAACATIEPRAYFAPRKFGQALDYLKKVKMGQTERGSYTVTVISKVAPVLQQPELPLEEIEDPFERRVIKTFSAAVAHVRTAAEAAAVTGSLDAFKQGVPSGISANFCDALVGMTGDRELLTGLEFSFSWSRTRPPKHDNGFHRILISPDSLPVIEEAGRLLREISPKDEFELQGIVIALERLPNAAQGKVTVLGFVDERPHSIRIELPNDPYEVAVHAHEARQPIFALGVLVKEGRSYFLRQPRGFRLIEPDQGELQS